MTNTSFYVLNNIDTGSETVYETAGDASDAVNSQVDEGDHWAIFERDRHREARFDRRHSKAEHVMAWGCGRNQLPGRS